MLCVVQTRAFTSHCIANHLNINNPIIPLHIFLFSHLMRLREHARDLVSFSARCRCIDAIILKFYGFDFECWVLGAWYVTWCRQRVYMISLCTFTFHILFASRIRLDLWTDTHTFTMRILMFVWFNCVDAVMPFRDDNKYMWYVVGGCVEQAYVHCAHTSSIVIIIVIEVEENRHLRNE